MSHGINAYYRNIAATPAHVQQTPAARPAVAAEVQQKAAPGAVRASGATAQAGALTEAEAQLINRYFPESESMSLRLYGPRQQALTLNAANVGSRLDIQG